MGEKVKKATMKITTTLQNWLVTVLQTDQREDINKGEVWEKESDPQNCPEEGSW